jgi:hypothetical protein
VAVDASGNVYVTDLNNLQIFKSIEIKSVPAIVIPPTVMKSKPFAAPEFPKK